VELLTTKRITFHLAAYQNGTAACPTLDGTTRFLRSYNNTGNQDPTAEWQVSWDNEWEAHNFKFTEDGTKSYDPDGAIRHTESRNQAEENKAGLKRRDEFNLCLGFIPGIRHTGSSSRGQGYCQEAQIKVHAGINHLVFGKWLYIGRTCGHTEKTSAKRFYSVKPIDTWVKLHKNFDLECQGDFEVNQTAKIADIGTLPCQRPKCNPYLEHSIRIRSGHQETKESLNAGVFKSKRRRKDRANRAARQIQLTDLCVNKSKLAGTDIGNHADHPKDLVSESEIKPSHKVENFPTDQQLQSSGQVPAVVEYKKIFGEITKNPQKFAFPATFPPYTESWDPEKINPSLKPAHGKKRSISDYKRILEDQKSGLNPLKLDYESDTSSNIDLGLFGDDSPGGKFQEADLDLLPAAQEKTGGFSPQSPDYSPEYRIQYSPQHSPRHSTAGTCQKSSDESTDDKE